MAALGTLSTSETLSIDQTPTTKSINSATTLAHDERRLDDDKKTITVHSMRTYTRAQILFLHNSPLVQLPPNMPELKYWFGDNEQSLSKKDAEIATPGPARDRRFRRDADDGEAPSRPSFRSTLSQPSQMGNFKHQSLRQNDRDRERDGEKDRQRDIRDKEGQEKLRHLSDKYDRERNKERDTAPHLAPSSSTRSAGQSSQTASMPSRRSEATKKKAGEASEDWRRGADLRSTREDRLDNGRKDRSERDRPRSRARDSSRSPRDLSSSRRERDRDIDYREGEGDDPRRWRDDGKRDERLAARRGDRHADAYRDRDKEPAWDRRWMANEERDGRSKRAAGRERKVGPAQDEGKDREDRRDRDREKEKEPAWMDTYIPPPSGAGLLGGKGTEGELDGIQAWKKGMREKELVDKNSSSDIKAGEADPGEEASVGTSDSGNKQLDEIQLFRLLMKQEEERKKNESLDATPNDGIKDSVTLQQMPHDNSANLEDRHPSTIVQAKPEFSLNSHTPPSLERISSPAGTTLHSVLPVIVPNGTTLPSIEQSYMPRSTHNHSPQGSAQPSENSPPDSQYNPPPGSRLLAFARTPTSAKPQPTITPNGNGPPKPDSLRPLAGFSPFEDQSQTFRGLQDHRDQTSLINDGLRRAPLERPTSTHETASLFDAPSLQDGAGYSTTKGSRFAKFFDGKARENALPHSKTQTPVNFLSSSPSPGQRQDNGNIASAHGGHTGHRAMDDIYAMLNSSTQGQRGTPMNLAGPGLSANHLAFGQTPHSNTSMLQQQHHQPLQHQQLQQLHSGRLEPLYDSRLDDRNFMPDGMVPGLRSAPLIRNRDNLGIYPDGMDDGMHFNVQQRLPPQQQRGVDSLFSGPPPPMYGQQLGRNNLPLQQAHYRGGHSPIANQQNNLQGTQQQRLPPGLANLGGRPPHEPSQFLGMPGMPSSGPHNALHLPSQVQQSFNNFSPGNNMGYGGTPQIRGPHPVPNAVGHHSMGGMGHNVDIRSANQNQILGMGGVNAGGLRGGFNNQGLSSQAPLLGLRQQQQLPPHMMPHLLPPHLQQQGLTGPNSQPAHDLMALLMGGHRE